MSELGPVKYLTIHCTANKEGDPVSSVTINNWDIKQFGQKSYHFIVLLDGTVVKNLPENVKGAHVGGKNTGNLGLAYVGGVDREMKPKDTRTPAQKTAIRETVAYLKLKYPGIKVLGHRDWPNVAKACPSFNVAKDL